MFSFFEINTKLRKIFRHSHLLKVFLKIAYFFSIIAKISLSYGKICTFSRKLISILFIFLRSWRQCGNDFRKNAKTKFLVLTLVPCSAPQEHILDELKIKTNTSSYYFIHVFFCVFIFLLSYLKMENFYSEDFRNILFYCNVLYYSRNQRMFYTDRRRKSSMVSSIFFLSKKVPQLKHRASAAQPARE
jgi:hypothetical protein